MPLEIDEKHKDKEVKKDVGSPGFLTSVQKSLQEVGFEPTQISLTDLKAVAVTTWLFLL
jgi:hypothetical protein